MKSFKKKSFCMVLVLALLLTACGSGGTDGTDNPTSEAGSTGGNDKPFIYVMQQLIGSIDPAKSKDETEIIALVNLYDPLFYPDIANQSMNPVEHIAESYTVSDDGLDYTIKIRNDVKFQSGNPLTAKDVAYSMTRMLAINEGNAWLWSSVLKAENISTPDDNTVIFKLNNAYAPFISSLTQLFVVDSETLKANYKDGTFGEDKDFGQAYLEENSAGSGPYKLTSWDKQSQITFDANEDYWKGWRDNQIKKVEMKYVVEEATVKTLLVSGQADMINQWQSVAAYKELETHNTLTVQRDPSTKLQYFPMNTQKAPTDDINIRKAIALAINYEDALTNILGGAEPAIGPVPVIVPGHSDNLQPVKTNIEEAKALVTQSKYSGGDLKVTFMYLADVTEQRQYSQLVTANLKEIGIEVELQPVTWAQITDAATSPETTANLTVISDSLKYPHVDSHTYGIYHPSAQGSYRSMSWFDNADVTAILDSARIAIDTDEQMKLYKESQDLIAAEYPAIYLANPTHHIAFNNSVKGYCYVGLMGYDIGFYYFTTE